MVWVSVLEDTQTDLSFTASLLHLIEKTWQILGLVTLSFWIKTTQLSNTDFLLSVFQIQILQVTWFWTWRTEIQNILSSPSQYCKDCLKNSFTWSVSISSEYNSSQICIFIYFHLWNCSTNNKINFILVQPYSLQKTHSYLELLKLLMPQLFQPYFLQHKCMIPCLLL